MKRIVTILAIGTAMTGSMAATGTARSAVGADITVTATVKNHPDNGHGTPSHWADDTFVRSMKIHNNGDGTFALTTTDTGTFTTRKGAGSPNNNVTIARTLTGGFSSSSTGTMTGTLRSNYLDENGKTFDDKNGNPFTSNGWASTFFDAGATGGPFSIGYSFTYKTADEQWIDASNNGDGTDDPAAGDITGKLSSLLSVKGTCRGPSVAKWVVTNVRGDRSRSFSYWVWAGHWTPTAHGNVVAGGHTNLTTVRGSSIAVHYYDGYGALKAAYAKAGTAHC